MNIPRMTNENTASDASWIQEKFTEETTSYVCQLVKGKKESAYIKGKMVTYDKGFTCLDDKCTRLLPLLEHGTGCLCKCGLNYVLYGNGLSYWRRYNAFKEL